MQRFPNPQSIPIRDAEYRLLNYIRQWIYTEAAQSRANRNATAVVTQEIVSAPQIQSTSESIPVAPEPINTQSAPLTTWNGAFVHIVTGIITDLLKSNQDYAAISRVYKFANVYNLTLLKKSVEDKLIGQISFGSVCNSLKMAKLYGGDRLMAESLKFERENRGNPLLPWAQLMNLTDADGKFLLDNVEIAAEKTSLKRKRTKTESE